MADHWTTTKVEDVKPGDVVRYAGQEFTVARVDAPFLGRDEMVCLIEDTPTGGTRTRRRVGGDVEVLAARGVTDGPLSHLRVLDLSRLQPGAYCTGMLADLGADVLRVEQPGTGDTTRMIPGALAAYHRGKRAMTLDLKHEDAPGVLRRLIAEVDVVVESGLPAGLAAQGVDYAQLAADQPGLVWCTLSGFGERSPYAKQPAHDITFLGYSGLLGAHGGRHGPTHPRLRARSAVRRADRGRRDPGGDHRARPHRQGRLRRHRHRRQRHLGARRGGGARRRGAAGRLGPGGEPPCVPGRRRQAGHDRRGRAAHLGCVLRGDRTSRPRRHVGEPARRTGGARRGARSVFATEPPTTGKRSSAAPVRRRAGPHRRGPARRPARRGPRFDRRARRRPAHARAAHPGAAA